jgi:DNA modification methylase
MEAGVAAEGHALTDVVVAHGDALEILGRLPDGFATLVVTSPPYNLGKTYERPAALERYLDALAPVVAELVRVLSPRGSLCWQVGNYVDRGEVYPLDILYYPVFKAHGLRLRNRIVWHFAHGLHASRRLSGRYEVLLWFTRTDDYVFHLDPIRVPAKYPGKTHYKGARRGQPSGNPLGKNPSDVWRVVAEDWESGLWDIPNVKANHPEKTLHPCQFPIEVVERCVLALTDPGDWVLDPFAGVGSALLAALLHGRRAFGCEKEAEYVAIANRRLDDLREGRLGHRRPGTPVFQATGREKVAQVPAAWLKGGA